MKIKYVWLAICLIVAGINFTLLGGVVGAAVGSWLMGGMYGFRFGFILGVVLSLLVYNSFMRLVLDVIIRPGKRFQS